MTRPLTQNPRKQKREKQVWVWPQATIFTVHTGESQNTAKDADDFCATTIPWRMIIQAVCVHSKETETPGLQIAGWKEESDVTPTFSEKITNLPPLPSTSHLGRLLEGTRAVQWPQCPRIQSTKWAADKTCSAQQTLSICGLNKHWHFYPKLEVSTFGRFLSTSFSDSLLH